MEDPKNLEGGGCTSYAIAMVTQADHLTSRIEKLFQRRIRIPSDLIGNPEKQLPYRTSMPKFILDRPKNSVSRFSIVNGRWSMNDRDGLDLTFYDPELFVFAFSKINSIFYPNYSRTRNIIVKENGSLKMRPLLDAVGQYFKELNKDLNSRAGQLHGEKASIAKVQGVILKP